MRVKNMKTGAGNKAVDQFLIEDNDGGVWFQSYDKVIALKRNGRVYLDAKYWNYSRTTSKYRNKFLGEDTATTRKKIDAHVYALIDLNSEVR